MKIRNEDYIDVLPTYHKLTDNNNWIIDKPDCALIIPLTYEDIVTDRVILIFNYYTQVHVKENKLEPKLIESYQYNLRQLYEQYKTNEIIKYSFDKETKCTDCMECEISVFPVPRYVISESGTDLYNGVSHSFNNITCPPFCKNITNKKIYPFNDSIPACIPPYNQTATIDPFVFHMNCIF